MLLYISLIVLIASLAVQGMLLILKKNITVFSIIIYCLEIIMITCSLIVSSFKIGFPAFTTLYYTMQLFSMCILIILLSFCIFKVFPDFSVIHFIGTCAALVFLIIAISPYISKAELPPLPALRSFWLVLHVSLAVAGEAFFTLSFFLAVAFFIVKEPDRKTVIDKITYILITAGYIFYTLGALIFGAVWAHYAWGSWWSWDPKETFALITWLCYSLYLHLRLVVKTDKRILALTAIIGYVFTIFTFFGVNYFFSGLHSY
jgi:cytochrome c-type biogenesis protein CcsB